MKQFLKEDVTYIDNQTIQDAFKLFRNDPDAIVVRRYRQRILWSHCDASRCEIRYEAHRLPLTLIAQITNRWILCRQVSTENAHRLHAFPSSVG